jgi:hypothetical protein
MGVVAAVVALSVRQLPPVSLSVALFAAAPLAASVAVAVLADRARRENDLPLRWVAAGLLLAVLAMVLQLISFPTVADDGGPLGTTRDGGAALYLVFHLAFALGAVAGAVRVPARWVLPSFVVGALLVLGVATGLLELPTLLTAQQGYTDLLVRLEWGLLVVQVAALVLWAVSEGPVSTPLRGWVGVALAISSSDIALNALAGQRYDALWWSSLTMRAVAFVVLAAGCLVAVLRHLRRLEVYSDSELTRRESQLTASVEVTERLLANARSLAAAVTPAEVVDALTVAAAAVAAVPRVLVFSVDADSGDLTMLGGRGYDAVSWAELEQLDRRAVPAYDAASTRQPVYLCTHDELLARYPVMAGVGVHRTRTACLAAVPMVVGGQVRGVLKVSGDRPQEWSAAHRELLAGLAAQGAQALDRARMFEHEHSAAEHLQRALLPRALPSRSDVGLAARYLPGVQGVHVGGDWYDCIECGEQLVLVVGDVIGMGLQAATTMGQLRTATRVLAALDPDPRAVLSGLDEVLSGLDATEVFATLLYVLLEVPSGRARIGRAGHVPLLVAPPGQPVRLHSDGGSLPLGAPTSARVDSEIDVPSGTVLVLYSDGLVEWHPDGVAAGLDQVVAHVSDSLKRGRCSPDQVANAVLVGAPDPRPDDIAVLAAVVRGAAPGSSGGVTGSWRVPIRSAR